MQLRALTRIITTTLLASLGLGGCSSSPAASSESDSTEWFALPSSVQLGAPSPIAVADLDRDGMTDLVAMAVGQAGLELVIAWGDPLQPWHERDTYLVSDDEAWAHESAGTDAASSRAIAVDDWNDDGELDIATVSTVLFGVAGQRAMVQQRFEQDTSSWGLPVSFITMGDTKYLLRALLGRVERCTAVDSCEPLPLTVPFPSFLGSTAPQTFRDMVVADFDHDGRDDVLAGYRVMLGITVFEPYSLLWRSTDEWAESVRIDGIDTADYQIGDVNADGYPDVIAQRWATMPDFPSTTEVWISEAGGDFNRGQRLHNPDNHNFRATTLDYDDDGCADYAQVGTDSSLVFVLYGHVDDAGRCDGFGNRQTGETAATIAPSWFSGVPFDNPTGAGAVGVQYLDANGDGAEELVVRHPRVRGQDYGDLSFLPARP